jgi:hypothetical protein
MSQRVSQAFVERRRRNFTTGPSPTGPQVLHQRDQRRIHGPSPCSIASPITHVASLAQSTVSHPRRRASPEHGLRIVSGFANQTLRVLSSNRILLPHLLSMRPLPEMDVLKLSSNSFLLRLRRRVDQEGHRIGRWLRSIGNGTIHPTLPSPMSSTPSTKSFPRPSVIKRCKSFPRPSPRPSSRRLTNNAGPSPTSMQVLHLSIEWSQHPTSHR